jgi:hypothetical protein
MLKKLMVATTAATVLAFGGVAVADVITGSAPMGSSLNAKSAERAARKALQQARKMERRCAKLASRGRSSSACAALNSYSLITTASVTTTTTGSTTTSSTVGSTPNVTAVPEPTTLALLGGGLLALGLAARRRKTVLEKA